MIRHLYIVFNKLIYPQLLLFLNCVTVLLLPLGWADSDGDTPKIFMYWSICPWKREVSYLINLTFWFFFVTPRDPPFSIVSITWSIYFCYSAAATMVYLKAIMTALAAWATLAQAAPVDSYEGSSALSPRASYVTKSGLFFIIDGTTKYFAGTNSY